MSLNQNNATRLLLASLVYTFCIAPMPAREIASPDGRTTLTLELTNGKPTYAVSYDGAPVINASPLGFKADIGNFTEGITFVGEKTDSFHVNFKQDRIKHSTVDFKANRLVTEYKNSQGKPFAIEWLVGDNDIAFRYLIPRQGDCGSAVILDEATSFRFPDFTTTFITPQSDPMIGWKRTKPSYEENYTNDAPMTQPSQYGRGYTFPALFHVGDNAWALVSETGVDGSYCASHLGEFVDGRYKIEYPMPEENNGNGSAAPGIALPRATPWRTITLGKTLKPIVETVIPWAPLQQLYQADAFTAGKGTWSWIIWQDGSINYEDQKKYIDLAADMGYDYALVDCAWDINIGRDRMAELMAYARSKGVNIALWYSSSGWWNDIIQSPTDIMSRPIPRKKEMKWLRELGVKTIKVDFFGGDKQETMRLYEDILSDASDYGLSVIFHGCTLPRGWERLYPNYVGSEAVLASENLIFQQEFCDAEAFNATLHPFIRNTVGCMEYGGSVLNRRMSKNNNGGNIRRTSDGFQLATAILFQNPLQNFAITPEAYREAPADAIDFMKEVPTTWDETIFIDGYPGKYVILARRHGDIWYIAGVNALGETLELSLDLPMLSKGQVVHIFDEEKGNELKKREIKVKNPSKFNIRIKPLHGFVIETNN